MMSSMNWIAGIGADVVLAWLLTYAVHSTILLGVAAVLTMRWVRADAWRETVWRAALVGALLTSALQSGLGLRPLAGQWRFSPQRTELLAPAGGSQEGGAALAPPSSSLDIGGAAAPSSSSGPGGEAGSGVTESFSPEPTGVTAENASAQRGEAGSGAAFPAPAQRSAAEARGRASAQPPPVATSQSAPPAADDARVIGPLWSRAILGSWAAIALLLLVRLAHRQWRLHRWLRDRRPVTDGALLSVLAALRRNAGVWRPVELTASPACPGPLAMGTSEICVPDRFLRDLDPDQQRSALAHELAHIARRDPGWQLVTGLVEALFFFQPLNRVARLRLREAAEHLSDDWAVHQTGSALGLARCLAEVASWVGRGAGPVMSGTMAMAEGGSPLLQRVERLLGGRAGVLPRGRLRTTAATALVLSVLVAAPVVSAGGNEGAGPASGGAEAAHGARGDAGVDARPAGPGPGPETSSEPRQPLTGGTGSSSGVAAQEEVIRHGAPDEPLDARWRWAADEAGRRDHAHYWVAYAFERPLPAGQIHVDDSGSWSTSELDDEPLGALIYGPSYERPDSTPPAAGPQQLASLESLQPVLVMFRMVRSRAGAVHVARVSVRSASAGMRLGAAPVYWLGPAADAESFDWLRARFDALQDARLQGTVVEAMSMHESTDRVVPFLGEVIASNRSDAVREEAVEGLAWQPTDESVALLRETALEDQSGSIREEAAETLGDIGTPAAIAVLDELLRVARSDDVREEVVEQLANRQESEVLETLIRVAMEDPSSGVRGEALDAIATFPSASAVPVLERIALTHPRRDMRREAVEALGDVDPSAAADVLERLLHNDADAGVREEALDVLVDHRSSRAVEAIFQAAMSDPDPDVQQEAVDKLSELDAATALPRLERIIWSHPHSEVRKEAVEALADLPTDIALPALDDIIERHEDREVAREAVEVIGELGTDASLSRLMRIVREHPWEEVRREALDQLGDERGSR